MAIFIGEVEGTSKGTHTLEQTGHLWVTRHTRDRSYYVLAEEGDREEEVLAVSGLPQLLDVIGGAYCISRVPSELNNCDYQGSNYILWMVACHWDSNRTTSILEGDVSPQFRSARISWYGENEEQQLYFDPVTNAPITNAVGEFIYISHPVVRPVLEITRFELPPFNPAIQLAFANHTNTTPFYGAPTGCALMLPITSREEVIGGDLYNSVTYRIKFAIQNGLSNPNDPSSEVIMLPDGWQAHPLHEGNFGLQQNGNIERNRHLGEHAKMRLKLNGEPIPPGEDVVFSEAFLNFNRFAKVDFNYLNL